MAYGFYLWYELQTLNKCAGNLLPIIMLYATACIECIQRAGEVMYVPDGWYHAVVNHSGPGSLCTCTSSAPVCSPALAFLCISLCFYRPLPKPGCWEIGFRRISLKMYFVP